MPPRNNNLLQLLNNGVQRPARPDQSIPSDNTNVETPRQYQRRQIGEQEALRTMATIEAGRQITGNPDLPPDAAINAYNRAVAISQMQPDQLYDTNKLYPAGNPWTFKDNIRRALGYYTLAERDLAARLNLARLNSFFGNVMPNFGSEYAWFNPAAEYDATRQTALYLPNALTMGATFGGGPSILNAARQGWNAANVGTRAAGIGRQVLNLATRAGNAARAAAATAVQGTNILRPATALTFGSIPITMLGEEAANSPEEGFLASTLDAIKEHPFITGMVALPAIGWAGRGIASLVGAPKFRNWLSNLWYNNQYPMQEGENIVYYNRIGTPSRNIKSIYPVDQWMKDPTLLFEPGGHYEHVFDPIPNDLLFNPNQTFKQNLEWAKGITGASDDAARIDAVLKLPGNEALRTRYTTLTTARDNLNKAQETYNTVEGLLEQQRGPAAEDIAIWETLQNDINTALGLTPKEPILYGDAALNRANQLLNDAQVAYDTANAAGGAFTNPIAEEVNNVVTQRQNQAQRIVDFQNMYINKYNQMLQNWRNNHSRWNTTSKRLTWGGVGSGVAGILDWLIFGNDDAGDPQETDTPTDSIKQQVRALGDTTNMTNSQSTDTLVTDPWQYQYLEDGQ